MQYHLTKLPQSIRHLAQAPLHIQVKNHLAPFKGHVLTSLSAAPFSSSPTKSLSDGTLVAKVLYNLEYRARVPSAVLARASKLRASGSSLNICFYSPISLSKHNDPIYHFAFADDLILYFRLFLIRSTLFIIL